ncbi:MAG: DNA-formamidopyrimidine glycosylase [Deltaproteobacteria bacterium]|nr:DNA-formamidopyrimidine glycosylase [Deltaproteobacteria bacterium]
MPELPEVEVTRRCLTPVLVGRTIASVKTTAPSYVFVTAPLGLRKGLMGRRVLRIDRLGKYLLLRLDDEKTFVIHLGMTGQLFSSSVTSPRLLSSTARATLPPEDQTRFEPDSHTHVILGFEDSGSDIYFRDVRKFGKLFLLPKGGIHARLERLGIDALKVTGPHLYKASRKRKVAIKALLLDQAVVSGIGNIYADEALFLAGVRPGRGSSRLTRAESERLSEAVLSVLHRSIETGGSSISDYVAPNGQDGAYQDERHVYARKGEPCKVCGAVIVRRVVAQRSAHYCPTCQS